MVQKTTTGNGQAKGKPFGVFTRSGQLVHKSVLDGYAGKDAGESRRVTDTFHEQYDRNQLVKPLYNPMALARHLELNTYHARAVFTKARDTAGLGWELRPVVADPSEGEREAVEEFIEAQETPLQETFHRFMVDLEATGYATLELAREGFSADGPYTYIGHVPSHTVRMHASQRKFAQVLQNQVRWFKRAGLTDFDLDKDTGAEHPPNSLDEERRASEIFFYSHYTPRSDFYGLPDHIPALGAITGDMARRDYNIAFFDNYGVPSLLVFVTGDYDPGEVDEHGRTELENQIQEHFEELNQNPYSTLVLSVPTQQGTGGNGEVRIQVEPLAADVQDASFRLYRQDNRDEIISAHGVPPYRMGLAEGGVLGAEFSREATEIYKTSVIEPRQTVLEDMMNLIVLWGANEVLHWRFALAEIDTKDETHEVELAERMFQKGALTPNDLIRNFGERFGVEEVDHPAMNAHYIDGTPIDLDEEPVRAPARDGDVAVALEGLRDRLLAVANKALQNGDDPSAREALETAAQLRE